MSAHTLTFTLMYTIPIAHMPSLHTYTHTRAHTPLLSSPACTHICMYPHAHTPPRRLSVHTLGTGTHQQVHTHIQILSCAQFTPLPGLGPQSPSDTLLSCTRACSCTCEHLVHKLICVCTPAPTHAHMCEYLCLAHPCMHAHTCLSLVCAYPHPPTSLHTHTETSTRNLEDA